MIHHIFRFWLLFFIWLVWNTIFFRDIFCRGYSVTAGMEGKKKIWFVVGPGPVEHCSWHTFLFSGNEALGPISISTDFHFEKKKSFSLGKLFPVLSRWQGGARRRRRRRRRWGATSCGSGWAGGLRRRLCGARCGGQREPRRR